MTITLPITSSGANTWSGAQSYTSTVTVGSSGSALTQVRLYSQALTPANVAANTSAEQAFTVTGVSTDDRVFVNKPSAQAGLGIVGARVSGTNSLAITFGNFTGSVITPTAAETYEIVTIRM